MTEKKHYLGLLKHSSLLGIFVFLLPLGNTSAAIIYSVDMDTSLPGIQTNRFAINGDTIEIGVVMTLTDSLTSVAIYSISLNYDATELTFLSGTEAAPSPLLSTAPVSETSSGVLAGIEADTFGTGPTGPQQFQIATLQFLVDDATGNAFDIDFTPNEDGPFDATSDNDDLILTPLFESGSLSTATAVPEPSTLAFLTACGLGNAALRKQRRHGCDHRAQKEAESGKGVKLPLIA